jgi:hypothetical protein
VTTPNQSPDGIGPHEVELKLGLPSAAAHARLCEALGTAGKFIGAVRQENLFLDGPHGELSAARVALRVRLVREDGPGRVFLTLKTGGVRTGEVTDRIEWECPLSLEVGALRSDPSQLLVLDLDPVRELKRLVPGLTALRLLGGFTNDRRTYRVPLDLPTAGGTARRVEFDWELDRAEFPDGSVDHELEVELSCRPGPGIRPDEAGGWPDRVGIDLVVGAVRAELARLGVPTVSQPMSKYARFRERRRS